jgi:hypothetical protein
MIKTLLNEIGCIRLPRGPFPAGEMVTYRNRISTFR